MERTPPTIYAVLHVQTRIVSPNSLTEKGGRAPNHGNDPGSPGPVATPGYPACELAAWLLARASRVAPPISERWPPSPPPCRGGGRSDDGGRAHAQPSGLDRGEPAREGRPSRGSFRG